MPFDYQNLGTNELISLVKALESKLTDVYQELGEMPRGDAQGIVEAFIKNNI